jgi:hypothetical protein
VTRESELCKSGIESKVGPERWVCLWLPSDVEHHRNTKCSQYDKCLYEAAKKDWDGFTCSECPNFIKETKDETNL